MQKITTQLSSVAFVIAMCIALPSCKDDEPTKYKLSFAELTRTVNEDAKLIEVQITLDKAAPEDVTIDYSLSGTAFDPDRAAAENDYADYEIEDAGELEIEKGETSGIIPIYIYSDDAIEEDETIVITIDKVDVKNIEFLTDEKMEITIKQEDGVIVALQWPVAGTAGVADMDLLVRIGETSSAVTYDGILSGSVYRGFDSNIEAVFLPKAFIGELFDLGYANTTYGLSLTYYDGTLNPLDFKSIFVDVVNGVAESSDQYQTFDATYTLANINKWVNTTPPTIIAQTFQNNGTQFSNISNITVQASSSRSAVGQGPPKILSTLKNKYSFGIRTNAMPKKFRDQLVF